MFIRPLKASEDNELIRAPNVPKDDIMSPRVYDKTRNIVRWEPATDE